jgi:tetratricopeptide (TPR) repeat protein
MTARQIRWTVLIPVFCSAFLIPHSAFGEEVQWRDDYGKARHEASQKGVPLVIDIGTEACYWCKQLDTRTFRDPGVIALLNTRVVPLKIDANHTPFLVQSLRIQSYPTLVFASPDGKIIGYQEGFIDAGPMKEALGKLLAAVGTPDWMNRDFQDASKAIAASDYPRAITLLKNVVEDGKDRPVQVRARKLLEELEKQAGERTAQAQSLARAGKTTEAIQSYDQLSKVYAGTRAARDAKMQVATLASRPASGATERKRRATELLRQAREDYRTGQYLCCLERCEQLADKFTDLPEGEQGATLASEIKANPEWTRQAADQLSERLSSLYLSLAESWLKNGQPQRAVFYLERITKIFPGTSQATEARQRLSRLKGVPATVLERSGGSADSGPEHQGPNFPDP